MSLLMSVSAATYGPLPLLVISGYIWQLLPGRHGFSMLEANSRVVGVSAHIEYGAEKSGQGSTKFTSSVNEIKEWISSSNE